VDAAEHHPGAAFAREPPDLVASQGVSGMNADADDIARMNRRRVEYLECFIRDDWIPERSRRGGRQHVEPSRRDDANPEREMARIDQVDLHEEISSVKRAFSDGPACLYVVRFPRIRRCTIRRHPVKGHHINPRLARGRGLVEDSPWSRGLSSGRPRRAAGHLAAEEEKGPEWTS
jgi:hypothetical protein